MTQHELERLLFDDILSLDMARDEHAVLREILGCQGANVLEVGEVLTEAVQNAPQESRTRLIERVCDLAGIEDLAPHLAELEPEPLALSLVRGVHWEELSGAPNSLARIQARQLQDERLALPPVPNLMFMRDACITMFDRVMVGRMATGARAREPLLVRFALKYGLADAPEFIFDFDDWHRHPLFRQLEGGDVLVLSKTFLMIGCSERTSAQTIERVAKDELFTTFPELERIYAVLMPAQRSVMHLDTILTQIDEKLFLGHEPMIAGTPGKDARSVPVAVLTRDAPPELLQGASVLEVLRKEMGVDVQLVPCGGDDPVQQEREQWTDGANAVCLSPGRIVLYSRNTRTRETLRNQHGFNEVTFSAVEEPATRAERIAQVSDHERVLLTFTGSELSRARGGGRCLTMPLWRQS